MSDKGYKTNNDARTLNTKKSASPNDDNSVATDLLHFYEDFVEFHDYCALLCDSFISFYVDGRELDINTAEGIKRYANWMKYRSQVLKAELRYIQEKSCQQIQGSATHTRTQVKKL